jgi:tetratricopeptide (TPR) repeat protein
MLAPRVAILCLGIGMGVSAGCAAPSATERAQTLARRHNEEEAIVVLRDRLRERPDDVQARRLLVRLLAFAGDLPHARIEVDQLARWLPPGDPGPSIELGHALELAHDYDGALAAYDAASRDAPASPAGPREGGMRAARWGELAEAAPRLEEAVRRGANDGEVWHALGLVRLHLEDYDGARRAYRAGAKVDPNGASNWLGLATVALARGDAEQALAAYDQVLVRSPRFGDAELGRAWALGKLDRKGEALRALDRAQEMGASSAAIARQRAALAAASPSLCDPRSAPCSPSPQ